MRMLLLPFSWIYGMIIRIRNWAFDVGCLKSTSFNVPIINIGNLSVGGTGKSPMGLYLAKLLSSKYKVAILSRGYGRVSKGFKWVTPQSTAREVGDEPLQYFHSELPLMVAVCEKRVDGVNELLKSKNPPEVIILDDAFQHRYIKPGFNILLSDMSQPFYDDFMLPAGNLREPKSGSRRADAIVFTKCNTSLGKTAQDDVEARVKLTSTQSLHFSYIHYREELLGMDGSSLQIESMKSKSVFLFCGIANPSPLKQFVEENCDQLKTKFFPDHHDFSVADAIQLKSEFLKFAKTADQAHILVTTRKDQMRLMNKEIQYHLKELPLYVVDIEVQFLPTTKSKFDELVLNFVSKTSENRDSKHL
ncbi:MAG: tetraacyldisaccharide 4'-kinase [Bacteroidia bacterium]|jgi:tetraacyldisaccharide 4'-kinase|nr:tetraacyldisaccharide 4'-kinase [Bacteroidia bacterium]MBP7244510.1 tetraacyldisaccharide 4'-kinase [Bacteroidia bacterium]